jgi:acyl carrier protein
MDITAQRPSGQVMERFRDDPIVVTMGSLAERLAQIERDVRLMRSELEVFLSAQTESQAWTRLAESTFAKDWNNELDAAYDNWGLTYQPGGKTVETGNNYPALNRQTIQEPLRKGKSDMTSKEDLLPEIKEMIVERLFLNVSPEDIGDTELIMEAYGIDSVQLFEIVVGLEEEYGVVVEDEEFSLELFETVDKIAEFAASKME